jgi:acyl-CoA reductase-like NAD-dependent aldehyde dehydrogenase
LSTYLELQDPAQAYNRFMEAILASSNSTFRKSTQNQSSLKEPRRPWWNENCQAAVSAAKKAEKEWRRSPLSLTKRTAWKKAEAVKKKNDHQRKKTSMVLLHQQPRPQRRPKDNLVLHESHGRQR